MRFPKNVFAQILLVLAGVVSVPTARAVAPLTEDGFVPAEALACQLSTVLMDLSPDGRYLIGQRRQPIEGQAAWLMTYCLDLQTGETSVISTGETNPVIDFVFASNDRIVLRFQEGQIYAANPDGTEQQVLMHGGDDPLNDALSQASILSGWMEDPEAILMDDPLEVKMRARRRTEVEGQEGVWRLNISTAEAECWVPDIVNAENWWLDSEGSVALVRGYPQLEVDAKGRIKGRDWRHETPAALFWVKDRAVGDELPIKLEQEGRSRLLDFADPVIDRKAGRLYYRSQATTDRIALMELDEAGGTPRVIAEPERADIVRLISDPNTRQLVGYETAWGRGEQVYLDPELDRLQRSLEAAFPQEKPVLYDWDRARRRFLISLESSHRPGRHYFLDRETRRLEMLIDECPQLEDYELSPMEFHEVAARDGTTLGVYLTRPIAAPEGISPMIVYLHDGPWMRDRWGFDRRVQFLADRGYSVLQVNFRGSAGFGRAFLDAGNREWAGTIHDDVTDAVRWAIAQGFAEANNIAIMGNGYGAFCALTGLIRTPDLYQAGLGIEGIYDLVDLAKEHEHLRKTDPASASMDFAERVGSLPEDAEWFRSISPRFHADAIHAPVYLFHLKRDLDGRTSPDQSYQMGRMLKREKKQVVRDQQDTIIVRGPGRTESGLDASLEAFLRQYFPSERLRPE